jgi:hypothetical protein
MAKIKVKDVEVSVIKIKEEDYISLTDMLRAKDGEFFFSNWLRNRNTIEFLGIWERLNNSAFNYAEFDIIKSIAGLNNFRLSAKEWTNRTNAIGIISKAGRYGGTYAHKDIAFEFAMWISPEFKVYLIKEFQRLKTDEQTRYGWNAKRELSKINYHIHTHAVGKHLIPQRITSDQIRLVFAEEADILNIALFGITAKQWREDNPDLEGNIRDYATINQLICLSNMENLNSILIESGLSQQERLLKLNETAIRQMEILENVNRKELIK